MKAFCLISLAIFLSALQLPAQKIQYSRQTFPYSFADESQLVTDVGGYHHLIRFTMDRRPVVHLFNPQLVYSGKAEIDLTVQGASDIRVILMQEYYYIYFHIEGSLTHALFKVSPDGVVANYTSALQKLMDSTLPRSKATYQLQNINNQLCLLSHTYFADLQKISSTVVFLDENWKPAGRHTVLFPFEKGKETLQQSLVTNSHLIVLKTSADDETGNKLQVIKTHLHTNQSLLNTFTNSTHLYSRSALQYNLSDSNILITALLRDEVAGGRRQGPLFVAQLDHELHEMTPIALLRPKPRRNIVAGFLLLDYQQPAWRVLHSQMPVRRTTRPAQDVTALGIDEGTLRLSSHESWVNLNEIRHGQASSVSFAVVDQKNKAVGDTVIENNGSFYDLQPWPFAQFSLHNKAFLLFLQNFSAKQKGLVLIHTDKPGHVTATPVPVFDRYEYFISQTQAKGNYFILPYQHKKEIGLVKITIEGNGQH